MVFHRHLVRASFPLRARGHHFLARKIEGWEAAAASIQMKAISSMKTPFSLLACLTATGLTLLLSASARADDTSNDNFFAIQVQYPGPDWNPFTHTEGQIAQAQKALDYLRAIANPSTDQKQKIQSFTQQLAELQKEQTEQQSEYFVFGPGIQPNAGFQRVIVNLQKNSDGQNTIHSESTVLTALEGTSDAPDMILGAVADKSAVQLFHKGETQPTIVNLSALERGETPDLPLAAGDRIYVPAKEFFFHGGSPSDFVQAADQTYGTHWSDIASIGDSFNDAKVPPIRFRPVSLNQLIAFYNYLGQHNGSLGLWQIEGDLPMPAAMMLIENSDVRTNPTTNGGTGDGATLPPTAWPGAKPVAPLRVQAFSLVGFPQATWNSLANLIAQGQDLARDASLSDSRRTDGDDYDGRLIIQKDTNIMLAIGTPGYLNLVSSVTDAYRTSVAQQTAAGTLSGPVIATAPPAPATTPVAPPSASK
jgi:hypothetical protein